MASNIMIGADREPVGAVRESLSDDSVAGRLIRDTDWSQTPLGPVTSWSPGLRTMVRVLLANRFPLLLWWGPEYVSIYNDAYSPILGKKHPWAMGKPVAEVWDEIWHVLKPLVDTPFNGGPSTWMEDIELVINRYGFNEETHFTVAYSPVPDDEAPRGIGGVLATVHEITGKVVGERRTETLRRLAARAADAETADEACAIAADILAGSAKDIPFALLYLTDSDARGARLAAVSGAERGCAICPERIDLAVERAPEDPVERAVCDAVRSETIQTIEDLSRYAPHVPLGPWDEPPSRAAVIPILSDRTHQVAGAVVAGISARLAFDEQYRTFFELIGAQIGTSIAKARAYAEEKRRAEALAELDRAKTVFFSNVSHEFRTPLTLLLGPVEDALEEPGLSPPARERLELVHRNALRLQRLVNAMLDFARIEAGRIEAVYEPTDLAALTTDLAASFRSAVENAGLRFVVDCPELSAPAYVDRDMWEKIVLNLLSNAFKHTFDGTITVSLRERDELVTLEVRDTGVGIPETQLPRLFERFHRVPNARSRTHEGSGIGLALVQELARLHGGRIEVESLEGTGTAFRVSIPTGAAHLPAEKVGTRREQHPAPRGPSAYVAEAARWTNAPDQPALSRSQSQAACILLADDNADLRDYAAHLLRAEGWEVLAVSDGQQALELARSSRPDVVLSDVMMPGLDGFGLLRALREDPATRTIPVILLSARAGEESRVDGLGYGADDYLVKPFSSRELVARVNAHLRLAATRAAERKRLTELLKSAPAYICVVRGRDHIYDMANDAVRGLVGGQEIVGRSAREFFLDADADAAITLLDRVLSTGETQVAAERVVHVRSDITGEPIEKRFVTFVYQAIIEPDGSRSGIFIHGVDVTNQVHAREASDYARSVAEDANRAKSDFLAAMSHELRTPLNAIAGHAELLELGVHGTMSNAQLEALHRIQRSEKHLLSLINDVLNFAKLEAGRVVYEMNALQLADVGRELASMIEPQVAAKGLTYVVDLPQEVAVNADKEKLIQVLINLLTNAIKFTDTGGRITVDTRTRPGAPLDTVFVRVTDTGIGIPRDKQDAIFDPFVQIRRKLTSSSEGTGLGLSISRDLARGMGGDLRVRSRDGEGSTFTVSLSKWVPPITSDAATDA